MDNSVNDLPLVGAPSPDGTFDPNGLLSQHINRERLESNPLRGLHTTLHEACINLYLYGTERPGEPHVFPKVQGMIHAFAQLVTSSPPTATIKSSTICDGGQPIATTAGEQRTLDTTTLIEWLQTIHDYQTETAELGSSVFQDVVENGLIFGWQFVFYDWDPQKQLTRARVIPPLQWYRDPTEAHIKDAVFVGFDWPIDAQEAKRLYPQIAAEIDANATRSLVLAVGAEGYSAVYQTQTYARPIVTLGIFWNRNRVAAMTEQEAIGAGLVQSIAVPMETANGITDTTGFAGNGQNHAPQSNGDGIVGEDTGAEDAISKRMRGDLGTNAAAAAAERGSLDSGSIDEPGETGDVAQPGAAAPPEPPPVPTREVLTDTATGQPISPDMPNWPRKMVVARSTQIAGKIVEDVEEDRYDIPVSENFNVKIPNRPYGQSDCIRVRTLQRDRNSTHTSGVNHVTWFKGPTIVADSAIREALPDDATKNLGMQPNKTYWWDRAGYDGKIEDAIAVIEPPPLPPAIPIMNQELDHAFDDAGGRPDALQGKTPTANASGVLAETLYNAASSSAGFRLKPIEEYWRRTALIVLHDIVWKMTPQQMYKINRTYDLPTIQLLIAFARSIELNISVEIAAAAAKQSRDMQTRQDFQLGLIDAETACDRLGYDYKQIQQRRLQAAMVAPQSPEQPGQPTDGSEPAGNGSPPNHQSQPAAY